jgi:hypothetical protein
VVVNNEDPSGQTHFRLFSGKPRLFEPKDLSKLHFVGIQQIGQIILGAGRWPVVEGAKGTGLFSCVSIEKTECN